MDYNYNYDYSGTVSPDAAGGVAAVVFGALMIWLVVMVIVYIYFAICLMKIANKTNTPNAWFAWIPILNLILMIQVARKPVWWIILFFIPLVNIIMTIIVWMGVAEAVGKPNWLGILMIVPIVNLIIPGYLAFSNSSPASPPAMPAQ